MDWEVGTGLVSPGPTGTPAIQSTTASNGYAMLCSDCGNNNTSTYEKSYLTTADPIDLSLYPNVILQFETQYRRFTTEQTYIAVSTDGINWPQPPSDTATVGLPVGLYAVWKDQELTQAVSPGNPTVKRINISDAAGGQANVWVRFYWYGIWGYAWYVDDVQIEQQPQFDLAISASLLSHTASRVNYGRIPASQYTGTMYATNTYENRGTGDQTNVSLTATTSAFTMNGTEPNMLAGDQFESVLNTTATLTEQVYECTFALTSDQSPSDDQPQDNQSVRRFEITGDVYSVDGIGNHPPGTELLTTVRTTTFAGAADGLYAMALYEVAAPFTAHGLEVLLGNGTETGGVLIASIHDSAAVIADDMSSPFVESDDLEIAQWHLDNGRIEIPFDPPVTLAPGAYYAAVQLFSSSNANVIRIIDDVTFPQPGRASMVNFPVDNHTYTNGNAYAIRLSSSPTVGLSEMPNDVDWIDVFPNPSAGAISIRMENNSSCSLELYDARGALLMSDTFTGKAELQLDGLGKGVYTVRVKDGTRTTVKRVTID
ncbi:MAG: T9SS type A sorting domain-containing protein [Flavobacteriales bacterium]|nr:MAG: T9SS type A sorting domain-containing protein [Flavobacteriales bacterium]